MDGRKNPGIRLTDVGFNVASARKVITEKPHNFKRTAEMIRQHIGWSRVMGAAEVAKIPFDLSQYIASVYKPMDVVKPLAVDLFCGLGGWAEGFLAEGYEVIGFDIERRPYPAQLVLQDVATLDGRQFAGATAIVASPPCQAYSYRAMPWKRAKALPPPDNTLFEACFRIQREASEAAGRYIPLIVENVCGAQKWVGRAAWHYGSYYLWGDVPALMPLISGRKNSGGSWFAVAHNVGSGHSKNPVHYDQFRRNDPQDVRRDKNGNYGLKFGGGWWHDSTNNLIRKASSRSAARKQASAEIAKIPFPLAQWIAQSFK
jgi:site-specific DNA-cytosine methylase